VNDVTEDRTDDTVVRRLSFEAEGPVELDLETGSGAVTVRLVDEPGVHVEVRHDPGAGSSWAQGLSSVMSWVSTQFPQFSGQFGEAVPSGSSVEAEAVRHTRVDYTAGRLVVRTPKELQLRNVPVAVSVQAPTGSHVAVRSGAGDVTVNGGAGRLNVHTGSGRITTDRAEHGAKVETGSGTVRLGPMAAGLRAKTGTADIEVTAIGGASTVVTGSGDVWLGAVTGDVLARTGSGRVTIANAASGELELHTGSGAIHVGIRKSSPAEVDLSSGSGEARSELDLTTTPPQNKPPLRVRGRTGSGSALVTAATE
jgi:putative adhesin